MNPTLLRQIYRNHGIRKKKFRWYKVAKDRDEQETRRELARMKRQLTMDKKYGYRIIYMDETMLTRKNVIDSEWTLPKQNVRVDEARLNEPTLALLSAISREKGQERFRIFSKSVDIPKFKEWLQELRNLNVSEKICLFMD